jgi:hypothetical protein
MGFSNTVVARLWLVVIFAGCEKNPCLGPSDCVGDDAGRGQSDGGQFGGGGGAAGDAGVTESSDAGLGQREDGGTSEAPCTTTLKTGDNLAAAVRSATADAVLCLASGDYGTVELFDIQRTGRVTLRSAALKTAALFLKIGNSTHIRLQNLTLNGALQNSCSRSIEWLFNTVLDSVTVTNDGCAGSLATRFEGNVFGAIHATDGYEGRLSLIYGSGIEIVNNRFGPGGASDGIFLGGGVSNVEIGPGNVFTGILESNCGQVHCDAVQGYGAGSGISISSNLFERGDTFVMMPDGSTSVTISDNVFDGTDVEYPDKIQLGTAVSPVFRHNTLVNVRASFDSKSGEPATRNAVVENNLAIALSSFKTSNGAGCTQCAFRSNLFDDRRSASGSSNIIGTPIFQGGPHPGSWAGWKLTAVSPGHGAASDGKDLGATLFGP